MDLKDTETEKNLYRALTGEALAHLKYQFYKSQLSKEYTEYETLLDEIIHNEKEHGKIWFKLLHDGSVPDNETNLVDAISGETFEHVDMYPTFAKIADEEGFKEIAELFRSVAEIEGRHSDEFEEILKGITNTDEGSGEWKCLNCGHIMTGEKPSVCPVCNHPQKYFKKI